MLAHNDSFLFLGSYQPEIITSKQKLLNLPFKMFMKLSPLDLVCVTRSDWSASTIYETIKKLLLYIDLIEVEGIYDDKFF